MRLIVRLVFACLIAASAQAQSALVSGPSLGFTSEAHGTAIRPILGIPGASILGDRIPLESRVRGAVISPKQNFAIAVRSDDAQALLIDLRSGAPVITAIDGVRPRVEAIAFAPTGSVAAFYVHRDRTIQVIGSLPDAPQLIQEFDFSQIPGTFLDVAVSDDGANALLRVAEGSQSSVWVLDASGAQWPIHAEQPTAAAFFPQSTDAIIADSATQSAYVIRDVRHAASQVPLVAGNSGLSSFSAVSTSLDGRSVFLADSDSGKVAVVSVETGQPFVVSCDCQTSAFNRLRGTSVFRLTEASREPMWILDASTAEPRIVIVPPGASNEEAQ